MNDQEIVNLTEEEEAIVAEVLDGLDEGTSAEAAADAVEDALDDYAEALQEAIEASDEVKSEAPEPGVTEDADTPPLTPAGAASAEEASYFAGDEVDLPEEFVYVEPFGRSFYVRLGKFEDYDGIMAQYDDEANAVLESVAGDGELTPEDQDKVNEGMGAINDRAGAEFREANRPRSMVAKYRNEEDAVEYAHSLEGVVVFQP